MNKKPTKLEIHLYDALENLICQEYADGINVWGEKRAFNAMNEFNVMYGFSRHDGKWNKDPMGSLLETIKKVTDNNK